MSRPQEEYDTFVRGSLMRGVDEAGRYAEASFGREDVGVHVVRRPEGYGLEYDSEMSLSEVYSAVSERFNVEGLIEATGQKGHSFYIDPDAWRGRNEEDFISVGINFPEFGFEWYPVVIESGDKEKRVSGVNTFSNTEYFDIDEPVFGPSWEVYWMVNSDKDLDAARDVFRDVRDFLSRE